MKILVDVEEQRSAVRQCLEALGVEVEVTRLPVGDYLVATDVAAERKTIRDLHRSLVNGALGSQVFALRRDTKQAESDRGEHPTLTACCRTAPMRRFPRSGKRLEMPGHALRLRD